MARLKQDGLQFLPLQAIININRAILVLDRSTISAYLSLRAWMEAISQAAFVHAQSCLGLGDGDAADEFMLQMNIRVLRKTDD